MKCIICGEHEESLKGICENCLKERINAYTTGSIEITECPKCGSVKVGNRWYSGSYERPLNRKLSEHVKVDDPEASFNLNDNTVEIRDYSKEIRFSIVLEREGITPFEQQLALPMKKVLNSCPTCNKVTGSYYEATVQLRTYTTEYSPVLDRIMKEVVEIMKTRNSRSAESFISGTKKVREGVDIVLGKRTDGLRISKYIQENYLSSLKVTKTLAGMRDDQEFYRFTYRIRIVDLEPGSIVSEKGENFMVSSIHKDFLVLIDLRRGNRARINNNDFFIRDFRVLRKEPDRRRFIVVSRMDGEMQLMDKNNFSMMVFKGDAEEEEIDLFEYEGAYYQAD